MKALSIINPWAWAIVNLPERVAKRIENRDWYWAWMVGRRFAIHVSKSSYDTITEESFVRRGLMSPTDCANARDQRGFIIGTALNSSVVTDSVDPWFDGKYGLVLRDVFRLPHLVAARGRRMWWDVPPEIAEAVAIQERA